MDKDFSEVLIKGRASKGNLLTRNSIHRIGLKSRGGSTLGGRKVWFDDDVKRLNYDDHGRYLGEFGSDDRILVVLSNGDFYLSTFDLNNHYEDNILRIEKYEADKVWTAVLYDASQNNCPYMKRFVMEASAKKQNWLGENPDNQLILLTDTASPVIEVSYGGADAVREPLIINAEEFISVKGFKAKGKRITTFTISTVTEQIIAQPEEEETEPTEEQNADPDDGGSELSLFD